MNQKVMRSALSSLTMKEKEKTMKNPRFTRNTVTAIALAMVMLVILIPFAHAEGPAKGAAKTSNLRERVRADIASQSSDRRDQDQYSQDELEQLRSALLELAGGVKDLTELAPNRFDTDRLDEVTKQIAEFSYNQLAVLRKGLNPSKMHEKLAAARASIAEYKGSIQSQSAGQKPKKGGVVRIATAGFPARDAFCSSGRFTAVTLAAVDLAYFAAEGIRDAAKDACLETLVVLGEGGNTSLVCLVTDVIYIIAHAVWESAHFCNEEFTDATVDANYERLEHLHEDLAGSVENDNSNKTMIVDNDNSNKTVIIADIDSKAAALSNQIDAGRTEILNKVENKGNEIISNDNVNKTLIINNDNANTANIIANAIANKNELRDLIRRTQIEADLGQSDSATPVALYETPTALGGHLDLVATIVTQTLANIQAAGGNTSNAQSFLTQANAAKAAGQFKIAYALYRKAYKAAAN